MNGTADCEKGGYLNVFDRQWVLLDDQKLSEKDDDQAKIMNMHLHVLEAYSLLCKVDSTTHHINALKYVLEIYLDRFAARTPRHLILYFDQDWLASSKEISFGLDIESSWFIWEAAELVGDPALMERVKYIAVEMVDATVARGVDEEGGIYEKTDDQGAEIESNNHWWPQAEAVVEFLNAYQLTGNQVYLEHMLKSWSFIKKYFIDLDQGEWHWLINDAGQPTKTEDKAGPWKAPYHNVRMCLEVLDRLAEVCK